MQWEITTGTRTDVAYDHDYGWSFVESYHYRDYTDYRPDELVHDREQLRRCQRAID
jgi:hypothetical protein